MLGSRRKWVGTSAFRYGCPLQLLLATYLSCPGSVLAQVSRSWRAFNLSSTLPYDSQVAMFRVQHAGNAMPTSILAAEVVHFAGRGSAQQYGIPTVRSEPSTSGQPEQDPQAAAAADGQAAEAAASAPPAAEPDGPDPNCNLQPAAASSQQAPVGHAAPDAPLRPAAGSKAGTVTRSPDASSQGAPVIPSASEGAPPGPAAGSNSDTVTKQPDASSQAAPFGPGATAHAASQPASAAAYSLAAVVVHHGAPSSGHYTTFRRIMQVVIAFALR